MAYTYDFAGAAANKAQAKSQRIFTPSDVRQPDEPFGRLFPQVMGYTDQDARLDPDQLLRASELGLIQRILWQLTNTVVYKRDIKINPPEDQDPEPLTDKTLQIQRQIKALDKLYQVKTLMKQTQIDDIVEGSGFVELGLPYDPANMAMDLDELINSRLPWPKVNGWKAPAFAEYRDATSFTIWPPGIAPIGPRWVAGRSLKGVVYDSQVRKMLYWQSFHNFIIPIQIPTCRVMHIKDQAARYVDGLSYLAGVMPSVQQQEFSRKVMMLAHKRWGAGQVGIKVGTLQNAAGMPIMGADPEGKGRSRWQVANQWADDIVKNWDNANAFKLLEEHELIYPPVKIGGDLSKPNEYFKKEILQQLIPRDLIEQNNGAMSASSDPLIDFFMLVVNSWRPIIAKPWENLFTKLLEINGFEGWSMEYVFQTPDFRDSNKKHANSLQAFQSHAITRARFLEETDRSPETPEEAQKIEEEIKLYAKPAASPFGGKGGNSGSEPEEQDGIEGEETEPKPGEEPNPKTNANAKKDKALDILKSKSQIAIETLKEFYSFEDSEPAKAQ